MQLGFCGSVLAWIVSVLGFAAPALAEEDCSGWLPDFRCERQARFTGFSAPVSAAFLFEEPFVTTGVSTWGYWQSFPNKSVFGGGNLRAVAMQARVALTERFGLIATKDGYIDLNSDNPLLSDEEGWADLGFGFKYEWIRDEERRLIVTPSLRYEATNGSRDVFSGNGQGMWQPGLSVGLGLDDFHLLGGLVLQLPVDQDAESTVLSYHLHVDREIRPGLAPFVELNGYRYLQEGDGQNTVKLANGTRVTLSAAQAALGLSGFEGMDLVNLGSDDVRHNDVITWAIGFRAQLTPRVSLGFAYERPLTRRRDLLKQRFTLNLLFEL